jgi:hypothetical protein
MQPYRPLPLQIEEQLAAGRSMTVELDAWYLPDTAASSYRSEHVKTSVAVEAIDREGERLRYFHNAGLHELAGDDYRGVFARGEGLPPYTELVRFDAGPRLEGEELRAAARASFARHLARRPQSNPFDRFGEALARALPELLDGDAQRYHDYAFATVRMAGAAFELCGAAAAWLYGARAGAATAATGRIVDGCKVLSFRLARRRAFDPEPLVADLAAAWDDAQAALDDLAAR